MRLPVCQKVPLIKFVANIRFQFNYLENTNVNLVILRGI